MVNDSGPSRRPMGLEPVQFRRAVKSFETHATDFLADATALGLPQ